MKFSDWIRPGIKLKRWIVISAFGIMSISFGFSYILREVEKSNLEKIGSIFMVIIGICMLFISVINSTKTVIDAIKINSGFKLSLDSNRLSDMLIEKRILIKGPKILVIGGGTGLSTLLRGLKNYSSNLTAIVTVADDGGGSGALREDLGMLPPGDIRNCILALADTEPILEQLLQYRFEEGMLKGQSFGNLFLAAMNGISDSFEEAVKKVSDVLAVTGKVLPVTLEDVELKAKLDDGYEIEGESKIGCHNDFHPGKIKKISLNHSNVVALPEALESISEADVIIMGPGSLYTSIIPNLLVKGVCSSIDKSKAVKIYISNIMTQNSETDGFTLYDHIKALEDHSYEGILDYCIVNKKELPNELIEKYKNKNSIPVKVNKKNVENLGIKIIEGDLLSIENDLARHNYYKLSEIIIELILNKIILKDSKRAIDNYYIRDRLKKMQKRMKIKNKTKKNSKEYKK
ncbi:MAG: gluconeogenesis factor YvcK family protein [Clostridiales bacterium]